MRLPGRTRTAGAMRVLDWSLPVPAVEREVLRAEPSDPDPHRPPLLFVHGLWHNASFFAESWLPRAAAAGWSAHAVSLRAHGGSGGSARRSRITVREYEHDVLQVMAGLPRPPVLVGHSLGALVVARVMVRAHVPAAVLLTPVGIPDGLGTVLHNVPRIPGQIGRVLVGRSLRPSAQDMFHALPPDEAARYLPRYDPEPPLVQYQLIFHRPPGRPVGSPAVVVVGAQDDALQPRRQVQRAADFYGVPVHWLPGLGHDVMLDAGREEALDAVLAALDAALPPR